MGGGSLGRGHSGRVVSRDNETAFSHTLRGSPHIYGGRVFG
nr:MAG TPA: hypothetical protein [Caudoviricetes sp.]